MSEAGGAGPTRAEVAEAYRVARNWILGALHELPAGVLWGAHSANAAQCAEMLQGLEDFAKHCARLGLTDHEQFIEQCRWHFDHYSHYLSRRRHFADYASYVLDRHGPIRVQEPPIPQRLARF